MNETKDFLLTGTTVEKLHTLLADFGKKQKPVVYVSPGHFSVQDSTHRFFHISREPNENLRLGDIEIWGKPAEHVLMRTDPAPTNEAREQFDQLVSAWSKWLQDSGIGIRSV